jgi:glucokinase
MSTGQWAIGIDLGGTKIEIALVDSSGNIGGRINVPTDVKGGPSAIIKQILDGVTELSDKEDLSWLSGVGIGVAGQIMPENGVVRHAPNLKWDNVPIQEELAKHINLPVAVVNDVRAVAWGEWLHGAGKDCDDLVCIFVGTGIGGGVVSGGHMLSGCTNTAGELGHMTVKLNGPECTCGNNGCLEALASGWAIGRDARKLVSDNPDKGAMLLKLADGKLEDIDAETVEKAYHDNDALAHEIIDGIAEALAAGMVGIVNAFNPCRLILGGGVIEGLPELIKLVEDGIRRNALAASTSKLEVLQAKLHNDAGVIGAAALVFQSSGRKE